eukprot:CAMPEP_0201671874 /NCGR_PEP_ID=MMETSP0494-20130426/30956_1 /ASSEMBLY_ACC=CAM_ASM_000839 /TAXON_ID=420259 /ORGANISM="Thalassiosira gravida, Strain GMp14c1" /LENGTH=72 /DNA_ID=CAMNT_0048153363 /DNA_START=3 /DNA_END=217 /DNA_ORIENTATION=-
MSLKTKGSPTELDVLDSSSTSRRELPRAVLKLPRLTPLQRLAAVDEDLLLRPPFLFASTSSNRGLFESAEPS